MKRLFQVAVLSVTAVSMASADFGIEDEYGRVQCDQYASTEKVIMMGRQAGEPYSSALTWWGTDRWAKIILDQAYAVPIGDTVSDMTQTIDGFAEYQLQQCKRVFG